MACSLYNNNGYGCGGCVHFVKTNSVTVQDGVLILNIPQASYSNKERVCIFICYLTIEGHGVGVEECYWKRSTMKKKYWETMFFLSFLQF